MFFLIFCFVLSVDSNEDLNDPGLLPAPVALPPNLSGYYENNNDYNLNMDTLQNRGEGGNNIGNLPPVPMEGTINNIGLPPMPMPNLNVLSTPGIQNNDDNKSIITNRDYYD